MKNKLMVGFWKLIINVPSFLWEKQIAAAKRKFEKENKFITEDHRQIHHFIVKELPYLAKPMQPDYIAERIDLPIRRVKSIIEDLDEHMTFICRNSNGEIVWAYPVTVEKTPHHITFNTGEQLYAA
jgi:hypothetical protein